MLWLGIGAQLARQITKINPKNTATSMNHKSLLSILRGVAFLVPIVLLATWYFLHDMRHRGTFGDMFGVATSLFTGIGLTATAYALALQSQSIQHQIQSFAAQAKEVNDHHELLWAAKQADVLMHCNSRFDSVWAQSWSDAARKEPSQFWDRFWNLQLDQYEHRRAGLISDRHWEYWMSCRHRDHRNPDKFTVGTVNIAAAWKQVKESWAHTDFINYMDAVLEYGYFAAEIKHPTQRPRPHFETLESKPASSHFGV